MAFPTILIDSTTGSDTTASGAGPSTALSGSTNASTDGTGLIVTLPSGTVLTGVATDGSHCIFLNDSTAGNKNFASITASSGSGGATPTVTVANAFGLSLSSKSWAIGGRRASIGGTNSLKLLSNNSAAGDAQAGWIIEFQSAHAETSSASLSIRGSGTQSNGPIIIRGAINAAVTPIITFSNNGNGMTTGGNPSMVQIGDYGASPSFELRNSNATKTASVAIALSGTGTGWIVKNVLITASGASQWWKGIACSNNQATTIDRVQVGNCASNGITGPTGGSFNLRGSRIFSNGGNGVQLTANSSYDIVQNLIYANTGDGINSPVSTASGALIERNTIYGNGGSAISFAGTLATVLMNNLQVLSNQLVGNTAYGLNFTGASMTVTALQAIGMLVAFNNVFNNTSGQCNLAGWVDVSGPNADPGFVNAAAGDFRIASSRQSLGYDTANFPGLSYRSYADIGAWQHAGGGFFPVGEGPVY